MLSQPMEERLLPDGRGGAAVHLSIQDDLVLLQLQDDLVDASDHPVDSLGQTLAGLGLLQRPLLASFRQLLLYLLQILKDTDQNCELRRSVGGNVVLPQEQTVLSAETEAPRGLKRYLVVFLHVILQVFQLFFLQSQKFLLLLQFSARVAQQVDLLFGDLLALKGR